MSEMFTPDQKDQEERTAELRGGFPAGHETVPLHKRPGYQSAVQAAIRAGLRAQKEADRVFSGQDSSEESPPPHQPTYTKETVLAERERAHREMIGRLNYQRVETGQMHLPIDE